MLRRNRRQADHYGYLDDDDAMLDGTIRVNEPNKDSAWAQQSVPGWNPVRSNGCVATSFTLVGFLLIVLGVIIQSVYNTKVVELEQRYDHLQPESGMGETVSVKFTIPETMQPPIFLYYKLTDYFQNHRLYAQSRHDEQLHGDLVSDLGSCYPLKKWNGKLLYPCGLIANSFFNDTVSEVKVCQPKDDDSGECQVAHTNTTAIAWPTDVGDKYNGRELRDSETSEGPNGRIPNPGDEKMMVWLRVAAMSTFKKLYAHIHEPFEKGKTVTISVNSRYPATNFRKSLVLSTVSVMGGSQGFLAFFCIIFGAVSILLAIIFYCINRNIKSDHIRYFYNPDEQVEADRPE